MSRRASLVVSPVRVAIPIAGAGRPSRAGRDRDPGERRAQVPLDVVGQGLERGDVQDPDRGVRARRAPVGGGVVARRSRHHRNAARVLPLPVGAWISVCRPAAIDAQPSAWAFVGASKVASNQARTGG